MVASDTTHTEIGPCSVPGPIHPFWRPEESLPFAIAKNYLPSDEFTSDMTSVLIANG